MKVKKIVILVVAVLACIFILGIVLGLLTAHFTKNNSIKLEQMLKEAELQAQKDISKNTLVEKNNIDNSNSNVNKKSKNISNIEKDLDDVKKLDEILNKIWGNAPDFELSDIYGNSFKLSNLKGKVIILDFFATWCPPCVAEIPGFNSLVDEYKSKGLEIVGVSLDDKVSTVKDFAENKNMKYHLIMGNEKIVKDYGGITGIPTTFIIDKNGNIVNKHIGYVEKEDFEKEIKGLL